MGLQPFREAVPWVYSPRGEAFLAPGSGASLPRELIAVATCSPSTLRLNLLAEPPLVAIPSFCLPFTFLGPSDFALLCRVCSSLICRNWRFSGVGRSVRIARCLFVMYLLYVVSIVVYCLLLDVVAGVVFGCRRIVDSVAGNVQWSHHCRGSGLTLRCGPS